MSSIALITDTHYGGRKGSKTFHDYFKRFYYQYVYLYGRKEV